MLTTSARHVRGTAALLLSLTSSAMGSLPELSQKELAGVVQMSQDKLSRLQVSYQIVFGYSARENLLQSDFQERTPALHVSASYSVDLRDGASYLKETVTSPDKAETMEVAFDGKVGTVLWPQSGSALLGEVVQGLPSQLDARGGNNWRPDKAAYWGVADRDLGDAIRSAKECEIGADVIDGVECYKVTVLLERAIAVEYKGEARVGYRYDKAALWLDPKVGMLPRKTETYANAYPQQGGAGTVAIVTQNLTFAQVGPGLWFPTHARMYMVRGKRPAVDTVDMRVSAVKVNDSAEVKRRVQFPDGCHVTDHVKGIKYTTGIAARKMDQMVDGAVRDMALASGGKSVVRDTTPLTGPGDENQNVGAGAGVGRGKIDQAVSGRDKWPWAGIAALCIVIVAVVAAGVAVVLRRRRSLRV